MRFGAIFLGLLVVGCTSVDERAVHMQNQIRMVQVQKEADAKAATAEANAKIALYQALADVARTNPQQASAAVVAMAVQGLGGEKAADDNRLIQLQGLQNEGLEYARVLAGPAMNVLSGVGIAAINANVAKTQSNNAARVQIYDAQTDASIVEAVAGVGIAAANSVGITVGGDYLQASDSASISQDQSSTTTTTTTETTSTSTVTDSYNTTDNSDNSIVDYSSVTYGGQEFSLPDLINYLTSTGLAYNLTIGDTVYTIDGTGEPVVVDCSGVDFSPPRAECI